MIAATLRNIYRRCAVAGDNPVRITVFPAAQTGLLTTLPLLAFALVSPLAAVLPAGLGWNAVCLPAADLRGYCSPPALRFLRVCRNCHCGCGIALGNVLLGD